MFGRLEMLHRRRWRNRRRIRKASGGRARLTVFRSNKNIYAQIIDDRESSTVVAASSVDREIKESLKTGSDIEAAKQVGELIAKRAKAAGCGNLVFDRGGYLYHGRVKALAESAREHGLKF
jgi:large subunit ribosomal protein L18